MPHSSDSLADKFALNMLGGTPGTGESSSAVCIKMSRVNHSCLPNAYQVDEPGYGVKMLIVRRSIKEGEEITIAYLDHFDPVRFNDATTARGAGLGKLILSEKYGIKCSSDCACHEEVYLEEVQRAGELDAMILKQGSYGKVQDALRNVDSLLRLFDKPDSATSAPTTRLRALYDGFQIGITKRATLKKAMKYAKEAHVLAVHVYGSGSEEAVKWKRYLEMPSSHRNYLLRD